jgi:HEAT repeat protein
MKRLVELLGWIALVGATPGAANAQVADPVAADEKLLQAAGLKTDGKSLLEFFHRRTLPDEERAKYRAYVKQLGSDIFRQREQAMNELVARGPVVVELLREALKEPDLEVARRAERCIQRIQDKDVAYEVPAAAARLLARQTPDGSVETMLTYLPFADNELVADEARGLLAQLAVKDGKPHPALMAALADKLATRRAAAGEALAKGGGAEQRAQAKELLADADVMVRLRVGLALVYAKEREAVPALIDLLPQVPLQHAWLAEDVLYRIAEGQEPPKISLGNDAAARTKCRDAWHAWWKEHAAKVDLAKLQESQRLLGHTVVVLLDLGRIMELAAADNQVRWQVNDLRFPLDVQPLSGDRLLVAEYHGNRVTERDSTGKVLWEKAITGPLVAQRLPNGNTFIATDSELIEYDRADKEVLHITRNIGERVMKAFKLANGEIACLTSDARIVRLDASGKELHGFNISLGTRLYGGRIHMQPNGRVLVPHNNENKVVEYDAAGKQVWEVNVEQPVAATRLPNGNTLVTSMLPQRGAVEFDPQGHEVWTYRSTTRVTRAVRR